jgi:integrase
MASQQPAWFIDSEGLAGMLFPRAAEAWLTSRGPYISAKTYHEYEINIRTLARFFGELRLEEITADHIRAYQLARSQERRQRGAHDQTAGLCGPFSINHETSVLQQMLKRIGRWEAIAPQFEPLPLPKESSGRVLSARERADLFTASRGDRNLEAAFLFAMLSVNTSAGPKEVMTLRLKDVDLDNAVISIQSEGAKNPHRMRTIPLNPEALSAAKMAVARARSLGAVSPEHYLFPFRVNRKLFDPTRRQTTFKTAWKRICEKAGIVGRLRMYDLRHTAITVMLEHPNVSEEAVEAVAGHVSRAIKKVYSHVRLASKRTAVSALDGSTAPPIEPAPVLAPEGAITNKDVLEMVSEGLPARVIAETIKKAQICTFDTSREALKALQTSGVAESVMLAMLRRQ